jgi:hypothetical protein
VALLIQDLMAQLGVAMRRSRGRDVGRRSSASLGEQMVPAKLSLWRRGITSTWLWKGLGQDEDDDTSRVR